MGIGYYHMYYNITSLVVGIGSIVEGYLKRCDEQFCFIKLCLYEHPFSKRNHMPNWKEIQGSERDRMTSDPKEHSIEMLWQKQKLQYGSPVTLRHILRLLSLRLFMRV